MKSALLVLYILGLMACNSAVPVVEAPGPHQTLLSVARMSEKGDFSGVEDLIFGIEYGKNLNSRDNLIDGFKLKNKVGDFSFTIEGFVAAATDYRHLFVSGDPEVLDTYFLKEGSFFHAFPVVTVLANQSPEKIWSFQLGDAIMILVEEDGIHKILYSKHIGALKRRPQ